MSAKDKFEKQLRGIAVPKRRAATMADVERFAGSGGPVTWGAVTGKPSEFTPSLHGHAISDVTGLATALGLKLETGASIPWSDLTGVPTTFPIADDAVTADKILDGAVNFNKIADGAVGFAKLADGAAAGSKIGAHSHTVSDISDLSSGDGALSMPTGRYEHTETIAALGVTASQRISVWLHPALDTDENTPDMTDLISLAAAPGTDQITVTASFREPTSGPLKIQWSAL